jgi:hypothetical protein
VNGDGGKPRWKPSRNVTIDLETHRRSVLKRDSEHLHGSVAVRTVLVVSLVAVPGFVFAGYAKQETEFHLDVPAAKVCGWIERHPADLERAAGAIVLAERDACAKLDQSDDHGQNVFWVKRSAQRGRYREILTESVIGAMSRAQTDILVVPNESGGCDVTIQMTATVDGVANMKIAIASRRAIRGMRGLVERTIGQ